MRNPEGQVSWNMINNRNGNLDERGASSVESVEES
jgi:hypothetical protein